MNREFFDPDRTRSSQSVHASPLELHIEQTAHKVIGAAIEVHKSLGPGFLESVYEEALALELHRQGITHKRQAPVTVTYKDNPVGKGYLDFLVDKCVVVELKAIETLLPIHTAQTISYLKATGLRLGLLINFNVPILKKGLRRVIL